MERIGAVSKQMTSNVQYTKAPVRVTITGAAGNIGYALIFMIGGGRLLGPDQPIDLTLLEIPPAEAALKGVIMELGDAAFPLINSIRGTTDQNEGFRGCQIALLVGARPRGKGMVRADLLKANGAIFKAQAQAIQNNADPDVKICVVGNPANTNAAILSEFAPRINPANVTSLTRLDYNRSCNQIAQRLNVPVRDIRNIIIWGNHSKTQFPDHKNAEVVINGQTRRVADMVTDQDWIANTFIPTVQKRGAAIIKARGKSSAASAASSTCDHIYSWVVGTKPGEIVSMGVMSDGSYGVPRGINFSFPVTCQNGRWNIVQGLDISDQFSQTRFNATLEELQNEKRVALDFLNSQ